MKTKEIIKQLQELDPSGELEAVIDGVPISLIEKLPAYYDGCLQMITKNNNTMGYKVTGQGYKILFRSLDLEWALTDYPDMPVDLSDLTGHSLQWWTEKTENLRKAAKED